MRRRGRSNRRRPSNCRRPASSFAPRRSFGAPAQPEPIAIVIASDLLTGELASRARRIQDAYEDYTQLRVLRRPLAGVYLSFFLMMTLMILVGATWMGLYLAKRITEPVQRLATAAREIEAGHLDYRVDRGTVSDDEFGSLVEAFNSMASEVGKSRRRLERSTVDLERKHLEVEGRRRYIETILERIATGVVSIDAAGKISTLNSAAMRLLGLDASAVGQPAADVFAREDLQPFGALLRTAGTGRTEPSTQEIPLTRDDRELQLAAVATALRGTEGSDGMVLVVDDVSPLIRAQKVAAWREVARRLAHEIKNPLTPIQLCAERIRRHFSSSAGPTFDLVEECTSTIVGEVDSLKAIVDEFSQFARMPAPRAVTTDLHALLNEALALYQGLLGEVHFERRFAEKLPKVRVDSEQIRRVIINLVDNAIEAMNRSGVITLETHHDPSASLVQADRHRQRPRHSCGRAGEAVHAVLFDQAPRQRPRPRDCAAHRRRAWRDDRGRRQRAEGHEIHHRAAMLIFQPRRRDADAEHSFRKDYSAPLRLCVKTADIL